MPTLRAPFSLGITTEEEDRPCLIQKLVFPINVTLSWVGGISRVIMSGIFVWPNCPMGAGNCAWEVSHFNTQFLLFFAKVITKNRTNWLVTRASSLASSLAWWVSTLLLKAFRFWGNGYEIQCGPIYWDFYCFFPCQHNPLQAPKSFQKEEFFL